MKPFPALCCGLWLMVFVTGDVRADEERNAEIFEFADLTPAVRERIDELAEEAAPGGEKTRRMRQYADVLVWLAAQTPLTDEEETEHATAAHEAIRESSRILETPPAAQRVFGKLLAELPARMKPDPFNYTLTITDEPGLETQTVGAGYVYLSRPYLEALLAAENGDDLLAFVLSRQIGHVVREDARLGYRLLRLKEELGREVDSPVWRRVLETTVSVSGKLVRFAYSRRQKLRADIFALHLCRNAGFETERGLDMLRLEVLRRQPSLINNSGSDETLAFGIQSLLHRLKECRRELAGRVEPHRSDGYRLYEFRAADGGVAAEMFPLEDGALDKNPRCVVFIHGMESDWTIHRETMVELVAHTEGENVKILAFRYPDDGSLARSGKFLKNEIDRVGGKIAHLDFVCHSAGGLVFRFYAEVERGGFHRAIFVATPHNGSDLAKLRPILEAKQFFGDLELGYSESLERAILDGSGQIHYDLQPESLFLRYLNRRPRSAENYYLFRGRALKPLAAAFAKTGLLAARRAIRRKIAASGKPELSQRRLLRWADLLELPEEIAAGDLAVTLESAELENAALVQTFAVSHGKLPRDPQVRDAVLELLLGDEGIESGLP